jgi:hypothetical protein
VIKQKLKREKKRKTDSRKSKIGRLVSHCFVVMRQQ